MSETQSPIGTKSKRELLTRIKEQLGVEGMVSEYMIPVETNTISYSFGGVLAISLVLELATGMLLATRYIPDAGKAYGITKQMLGEGGWSVLLNFHYCNAFPTYYELNPLSFLRRNPSMWTHYSFRVSQVSIV